MGTQKVQMKGALPWFARWACRAGTTHFCPALTSLVGPVQASWADSRAGSPVS